MSHDDLEVIRAASLKHGVGVFAKSLTPGEETSLEKVAVLRGECGRLRAAMRDALDQMQLGAHGYRILEQALRIEAP